jgi:RNA polymerase sigma-70 factor (ECF subfamily)
MTESGNEKLHAFEHQALAHLDALVCFGLRLRRNAAAADELVHYTYLKAYRCWDKYQQITHVRDWLFRIMKNANIESYRHEQKQPSRVVSARISPSLSGQLPVARTNAFPARMSDKHSDDDLIAAISGLPRQYRAVVVLSEVQGWTPKQIAGFVDCSPGTVRSRLHRGRLLLHARLFAQAMGRGSCPREYILQKPCMEKSATRKL